jgi:hypothetical protein
MYDNKKQLDILEIMQNKIKAQMKTKWETALPLSSGFKELLLWKCEERSDEHLGKTRVSEARKSSVA